MNYEPISREAHLARGTCCDNGCAFCPWRKPVVHRARPADPRILAALLSGETCTIYSDLQSLTTQIVLQGRITIVYKSWKKPD